RQAFRTNFISNTRSDMKVLREGLKDPEVAPYALKAMGMAHLDAPTPAAAVQELGQAANLLPWDAQAQGMFAYALYLSGKGHEADEQAHLALQLDRKDPAANLVRALRILDLGETNAGELDNELTTRLRDAASLFPGAHLILWNLYTQAGRLSAAAREMRE